jgi:hypothetical protein
MEPPEGRSHNLWGRVRLQQAIFDNDDCVAIFSETFWDIQVAKRS